jgi:N-acetylglucosaminyl-diphospho-decaprenol L-rhamnosyltransferase
MEPNVPTLSAAQPSAVPPPHPQPLVLPTPTTGEDARVRACAPRLSVIVVNYHQWPDTDGLIRQLRAYAGLDNGAAEVVVVENHSERHPVAARLRRSPGVSLRRWRRNHGFARAANEGCRLSRGDWLLLLNPDVTLDPGFIDAARALAERRAAEEPRLGVVGFALRNPDGSPQPSTGRFPTLAGSLLGLLRPRTRRKYDAGPPSRRRAVDWATGCCLLIRRACWRELGGLDPDYFLYYEDVDFCRRASAAGWSVAYEPSPSAIHHHPLHARAVPPHIRLVTRHALLTYARKHWPAWQARVLAGVMWGEALARLASARLRGDADAAAVFRELAGLAADLGRGRRHQAWRRLRAVVRSQEKRRAASPVGGDSEP